MIMKLQEWEGFSTHCTDNHELKLPESLFNSKRHPVIVQIRLLHYKALFISCKWLEQFFKICSGLLDLPLLPGDLSWDWCGLYHSEVWRPSEGVWLTSSVVTHQDGRLSKHLCLSCIFFSTQPLLITCSFPLTSQIFHPFILSSLLHFFPFKMYFFYYFFFHSPSLWFCFAYPLLISCLSIIQEGWEEDECFEATKGRVCVERGEDSALHGGCRFCGRACFPGERQAIADGTTDATDTAERFC